MVYSGILSDTMVTSSKWGVSQGYSNPALAPQYQAGYIQGGNGGTVSITSSNVTLNGALSGNTISGLKQTQIQSALPTTFGATSGLLLIRSIYGAPLPSALSIDFSKSTLVGGVSTRSPNANLAINFSPGTVTNSSPSTAEFDFSTDLVNVDGFDNLKLNDDFGTITLPTNTSLNLSVGGAVTLYATTIDLSGNMTAPGGTLNFSALGSLNLDSSLDVSGLIVDQASSA